MIKLDEHRYYKRISGSGIKCVDYLAIDPEIGLILIELKDYTHKNTKFIADPTLLQTTLSAKREGSIRLINIVNKALLRQLYYRIFFIKLKWKRVCPTEWDIWHLALQYIVADKVLTLGDYLCSERQD